MQITRTSLLTGIRRTLDINVTEAQLKAHAEGMLIQDAMPDVSADDREFIISGITKQEWDSMPREEDDV